MSLPALCVCVGVCVRLRPRSFVHLTIFWHSSLICVPLMSGNLERINSLTKFSRKIPKQKRTKIQVWPNAPNSQPSSESQ